MLPASLRLTRGGFEHMRGLSRTITPHFSISYGPVAESGGSATIVPKKVLKTAVERHLLKRRVRALLRPWSSKEHILIITARAGAGRLTFSELEGELSAALEAILAKQT